MLAMAFTAFVLACVAGLGVFIGLAIARAKISSEDIPWEDE